MAMGQGKRVSMQYHIVICFSIKRRTMGPRRTWHEQSFLAGQHGDNCWSQIHSIHNTGTTQTNQPHLGHRGSTDNAQLVV